MNPDSVPTTGDFLDDFLAEYALLLKWKHSSVDKAYVEKQLQVMQASPAFQLYEKEIKKMEEFMDNYKEASVTLCAHDILMMSLKGRSRPSLLLLPNETEKLRVCVPPRHWIVSAHYYLEQSALVKRIQEENKVKAGGSILGVFHYGALNSFKGGFIVPKELRIKVLFSSATIDLSTAVFVHAITVIRMVALFGGVKIKVPLGVRVQVESGVSCFGRFDGLDEDGLQDNIASIKSPIVSLRGVASFGVTKCRVNRGVKELTIVQSGGYNELSII